MRKALAFAAGLFFAGLVCLLQTAPAQILMLGAGAQKVASAATTTWNPSDKGPNITLSGGNLIATNVGVGGDNQAVRAIASTSSGKRFSQYTVGLQIDNYILGVGNAAQGLTSILGNSVNGFGVNFSGTVLGCGFSTLGTGQSFTTASVVSVALNFDTELVLVLT